MEKLPKIAEWLGNKQFLCGAKPTMVDFYLFEVIETLNAISGSNGVYTALPKLEAYHDRVQALPGMSEYFASEECIKAPFFVPQCQLNM